MTPRPESASSLMKSTGLKANPSFFGPDQRPIALTRRSTGRSSGHVWPGSNATGGFRLWWRQLTGSDATLDNAHVVEDYLARTTTMYWIIAVGSRTCSVR